MTIDILGIHDGHNAAAAFLRDGRVLGAVQEERFTRAKNQGDFPRRCVEWLLGSARPESLTVALNGKYINPGQWTREAVIASYGSSGGSLERLKQPFKRTWIDSRYQESKARRREQTIRDGGLGSFQTVPVEHHLAHASAAYYGSGWMEGKVLVLTCDGSGDRLSGSVNIGNEGRLERIAEIDENDSIGRVYATVTYFMGMVPLEHEYKIMGLAPYTGDASRAEQESRIFSELFEFDPRNPMVWRRRHGVPPIYAASAYLEQRLRHRRFDYVAAGLQKFVEDILTRWVRNCVKETGISRIACSGGVFMNVKANQAILALPEVDELFVYPTCGDESNAIGAAYWTYAQSLLEEGQLLALSGTAPLYLGPAFSDDDVEATLRQAELKGIRHSHLEDVERRAAEALAAGKVVARAKGPMEFGARALGNRSILARPDNPNVVRIINEMIKCRDFWMPFAPSVLEERAADYYVKPKPMPAPHMIITFDSRPDRRDRFPAAQHPYDFTTRPNEVSATSNPDYYRLLKHYESITGEGIVLNTSFNIHGEPIAMTPEDCLSVFRRSGLECMVLGNFWLQKE
ncbi:MAG TPA: carbamoyltransferase C-terminal domain-containing protein [Burkholderiales bacterium]|nr:carbamoyltransferase C-terminal domain-containing protein [Burkholderiales bacterium]